MLSVRPAWLSGPLPTCVLMLLIAVTLGTAQARAQEPDAPPDAQPAEVVPDTASVPDVEPTPEASQPAQPRDDGLVVKEIRVGGSEAEAVSDLIATIFEQKSSFLTRVGDEVALESLSNDIRRMDVDFGPFKDIQVDAEAATEGGLVITFLLTDYPRIEGDVEVVGNREVKYKDLRKRFSVWAGERLSDYHLWKTLHNIEGEYRDRGFYFATAESIVEPTENGEAVRLRIHVTEGDRVEVVEVRFEGNELVTDDELRKVVETRRGKKLRDEPLKDDPGRILSFYHENGMINARNLGHRNELDEIGTGLIVTFDLYEGPQFSFGGYEIRILEDIPEVSERRVRDELSLGEGDVFNAMTFRDDVQRVQDLYANRGNILANVFENLVPDAATETVHATLTISEGTTIKVGEIRIEGLSKTKEYVVRRELHRMAIAPGRPIRSGNLRKAQQNITQLGSFIRNVRVMPQETDAGDVKDLVIGLDENVRTGLFTIGGGYGSESGLFGVAEIGDANFLGRAFQVSLRGELGQRARKVGQLSFSSPWVLGTPTSLNAQIYSINRRRYLYGFGQETSLSRDDFYEDFKRGVSLRLGFPLTRDMTAILRARDESVEANFEPLEDDADDERFVIGRRETRSVTVGLTRDTRSYRRSLFDPIGGGTDAISFEHSGGLLGGRNAFRKYTWESSRFFRSFWDLVLALHLNAGYLQDRSSAHPRYLFYERYWLGGIDTVRGYPDYSLLPARPGEARVGESVVSVTQQLGGNKMIAANLEYRLPVNPMIQALAFIDVGQTWSEGANVLESFDPAIGVGAGVRLELVPGFLLRLEWGVPVTSIPVYNDEGEIVDRRSFSPRIHFSMGPSF